MSDDYSDNNDLTDNEDNDYISLKEYHEMETVTKIIYGAISIGKKEGIKIINSIVKKYGKDKIVNYEYKYWTSPLSYAIFLREEEVSLYLIELGFNINYIDSLGNNPINYSVGFFFYKKTEKTEFRENKEMYLVLKKLVFNGANIFNKNKSTDLYPQYEALINSYINSYELIKKKNRFNKKKY